MKKVTNLKSVFGSKSKEKNPFNDNEGGSYGTSILGNIRSGEFQLPRGISNIFNKSGPGTGTGNNSLRNSFRRKKEKEDDDLEKSQRSYLAPPMPPVIHGGGSRLRRVNSSTLSLNKTKKKLLTVEELYVEVLYTILHMIGCDIDQVNEAELISYVQQAFHMEDEKHQQLLEIATMKEEPYLKCNLEVHGARNLRGKDISGLSDPFCTFYLTTNPHARYNTSYKPKTLNPTWNEDFVLDVNSVEQDGMRLDVWDFNPEESVNEKLNKINQVKDGRGLRKFIKETLHATAGKISHELLGSVEVPLKNLPASGVSGWWNLEKPDTRKQKERGEIHLSLTLSSDKDQHLTSQEHRHLLKILFAHELQRSNAAPFTWNGELSRESVLILAQHAVQGKLTGADTALARWLVFCHTHCDLPLDYRVFYPILEKLTYAMDNGLLHAEEEGKFTEVAAVFVSHCVEFIKKHRHFIASDPEYEIQLENILKCLKLLREAFSKSNSEVDCDIKQQVEAAVVSSVEDWYNFILDKMPIESNRVMRVKNLTNLANILGQDLREGCERSHSRFKEFVNVNYRQLCYRTYERQLVELCRDFVEETCDKLRPVIFSELDNDKEYINNSMTIGTGLFELYLALQSIAKLGDELFPTIHETFEVSESHIWFNKAVARWLDIALYKAMQRIIKAVELDDLTPVDDLVQHSSSAVDIRTVLMQIKTFWAQLSWPDVESSYAYISKILDDVCKITIFYSDKMVERVTREKNNNLMKFQVSESLCLAINNIDYVLQYIQPFVQELGYEPTLSGLSSLNGDMVANSCRRTLTTLIQNAMENVENKILEVLENLGEKMAPVIKDFLLKSTNLVAYASKVDKNAVLNYLDENLIMLKRNLTDDNFERVLAVIWESSAQTLEELIYVCIDNKKPPTYFKTLLDVLKILCDFFYGPVIPRDETLTRMKLLLQLYASDTADLVSRYYWNRVKEQRSLQVGEYKLGSITIRAQLLKDHVRVEVLNARGLKPPEVHRGSLADKYARVGKLKAKSNLNMSRSQKNLEWVKSKFASLRANLNDAQVQIHAANTQGQSDPYISLRIVPSTKFPDSQKHRTRTQRRTLFPLFDETFDFFVQGAHKRLDGAYLQICVKDRGIMGQGIFLGEAYLPLQEVEEENMDRPLRELPQIQLPLTRPQDHESDLIYALDSRIYDRHAKDFLKRERRKL